MASQIREYVAAECCAFLRASDAFGALGNMAGGYPLLVGNMRFGSSEALYQALKFTDAEIQRKVAAATNGFLAKQVAKQYSPRVDWDKLSAMRYVLRVKYSQHQRIRALLASTGERPIVEISYKDDFWGARPDGDKLVGMNVLGRLWMEVRQQAREGVMEVVMPTWAQMNIRPLVQHVDEIDFAALDAQLGW